MQVFSHWEVIHEPGYWRGFRYYYPRSVWYPVYEHVIRIHIEFRNPVADRIAQIENETRIALALKRKVDAESALLDSYVRVAIQKNQLKQLLSIAQREELEQLAHMPAVEMDKVR
jgi:hypothetical protein